MINYRDRSQFYYMLSTMLDAGVSIIGAFRQQFPGSMKKPAARLYQQVEAKRSLTKAVQTDPAFSAFEASMFQVGVQTGRLAEVTRAMADWFDLKHRMRQKLRSGLLYPLCVYHFAGPLLALIGYVTHRRTLPGTVTFLVVWLALPWVCWFLYCLIAPWLRRTSAFCVLLNTVPVLGTLLYRLESASFFKSLAMSLEAGWAPVLSIRLAAGTCVNAWYQKRYKEVADVLEQQECTLTEAFSRTITSREKSSSVLELLETGETAGQLPEMCHRIANQNAEAAESTMGNLAQVLPGVLYGLLVLYLAIQIISFFVSYIGQINQLL